jgi:hypothetical protein
MRFLRGPTAVAALACVVLPFLLLAGGLTMTSATDVVIFAVACMALNLLVGILVVMLMLMKTCNTTAIHLGCGTDVRIR